MLGIVGLDSIEQLLRVESDYVRKRIGERWCPCGQILDSSLVERVLVKGQFGALNCHQYISEMTVARRLQQMTFLLKEFAE